MWLKDPKTRKKSVTVTLLSCTFAVALIKLLIAGMTLWGVTLGDFEGDDFALVVGTVGTIYWGRKHTENGGKDGK